MAAQLSARGSHIADMQAALGLAPGEEISSRRSTEIMSDVVSSVYIPKCEGICWFSTPRCINTICNIFDYFLAYLFLFTRFFCSNQLEVLQQSAASSITAAQDLLRLTFDLLVRITLYMTCVETRMHS